MRPATDSTAGGTPRHVLGTGRSPAMGPYSGLRGCPDLKLAASSSQHTGTDTDSGAPEPEGVAAMLHTLPQKYPPPRGSLTPGTLRATPPAGQHTALRIACL